jgi:hypothetical protein
MTADKKQKQFDKDVEESIKNTMKGALTDEESGEDEAKKAAADTDESKKSKKEVDKPAKKTDTDDSAQGQQQLYDAILDKVITEEFGGDVTKRDEAKAIANLAIKTFQGDPIRAAKSYKNLFDQTHQLKSVVKSNPMLAKMLEEAEQGKAIDENYVKSLLGTATSADEPAKNTKTSSGEQLDDDDDFDLDSLSADELTEAGVLNKSQYDSLTGVDKRDALEKARIRYGYKVLPDKIAERSARLTEKKQAERTKAQKIEDAKDENRKRLNQDYKNVLSTYDVDFDNNPEHKRLLEEIQEKAYRIGDIDDDSGLLVSPNAVEQATRHVFSKNGISLDKVQITDETKKDDEHIVSRMSAGSEDIMRRILTDADGFKGVATKRKEQPARKQGDSFDDKVNQRVSESIERNLNNSKMISGIRRADRTKTG